MTNKYPQLTKCIQILAEDNYGSLTDCFILPQSEWKWPDNAPQLETEAARLDDIELETFVCGEHTEQRAVVERHGVQALDLFIGEVFDGALYYDFFSGNKHMTTIAIITPHPEAVAEYFGFGCREVERGENKFGDHVVIAECPDEHAQWNAARLSSGLHGARIVEDLTAWKDEWGYVKQ